MLRRLTTIMAMDLAGYSRLAATDEEDVLSRLRAAREKVLDPAMADAHGRIVKTMGDGLLAEFASPVAAVRAALKIQKTLAESQADTPQDRRLRFRIGINVGDVVVDGEDLLGDVVNVAARLESLAPEGGICISRAVRDQMRGRVNATMTPLGPQQARNMPEPVEAWRVEVEGAGGTAAAAASGRDRPSIIVLPFDDFSAGPERAYLADGLTEDVTTALSRFRWLFVIARNTAFSYRGTSRDVRQIARELGVRYAVEGSVRKSDDRLRVTAQLIDAESGGHVWADRWDRAMADLFDVQDELAEAIVAGLAPELGAHERMLARARPTDSLTAWELCQRGMGEFHLYTRESLAAAAGLLERAIESDPDYALARAIRARLHYINVLSGRGGDPASEIEAGFAQARRAMELDPREDSAHQALGILLALSGRCGEARAVVEDGLRLNPNNAFLHSALALALYLCSADEGAAMQAACETALTLSPRDRLKWAFHHIYAVGELLQRPDDPADVALDRFERACASDNAEWYCYVQAAALHLGRGREAQARRMLDHAFARRPDVSLGSMRRLLDYPGPRRFFEILEDRYGELTSIGLPKE